MSLFSRACDPELHNWFPGPPTSREFIPMHYTCLRCRVMRVVLPIADCLDGTHRLAEHYDAAGHEIPHVRCAGPK